MAEAKDSLLRALTPTDVVAFVGGTVIGTGVFLKTAVMTQQLGSPMLVLLAWLALLRGKSSKYRSSTRPVQSRGLVSYCLALYWIGREGLFAGEATTVTKTGHLLWPQPLWL